RGVVVDRLEVQQDAPAGPCRGDADGAPVPDRLHEVGVAHAGQLRLRAEGDGDGAGEPGAGEPALQAAVAAVDLELPGAVEAQPLGPGELRARVLGAGNGGGTALVLRLGLRRHGGLLLLAARRRVTGITRDVSIFLHRCKYLG